MIDRIFVDLDGVLNRFSMTALKYVGCDVQVDEEHKYPDVGYELVKAANVLLGEDRFKTNSQFWNLIPRDLWATCPLSAEWKLILDMSKLLVGKDSVYILTSPIRDPDCSAGKQEWIQRFMPSWLHRQSFIGSAKHACAHPLALLIDDCDENCKKFREEKGRTILVPRPWNTMRGVDTEAHLKSEFRKLFMEEGKNLTKF